MTEGSPPTGTILGSSLHRSASNPLYRAGGAVTAGGVASAGGVGDSRTRGSGSYIHESVLQQGTSSNRLASSSSAGTGSGNGNESGGGDGRGGRGGRAERLEGEADQLFHHHQSQSHRRASTSERRGQAAVRQWMEASDISDLVSCLYA